MVVNSDHCHERLFLLQNTDYYQSESDLSDDFGTSKKKRKHPKQTGPSANTSEFFNPNVPVVGSSDSEYGSGSKKKRAAAKAYESAVLYGADFDPGRVSTRGGKVPNYVDETRFGSEDDDEDRVPVSNGNGYDPMGLDDHSGNGIEEDHEIEGVYGHNRDEEHSRWKD